VTVWRPLILAILVYLALDLSVAWMPGAFVFDADGTVESIRTDTVQEISDTIAMPAPALGHDRRRPERSVRRTIVTTLSPRPVFRPRDRGLRDAAVDAAPSPTDDPY
jgi:hypothetical protein